LIFTYLLGGQTKDVKEGGGSDKNDDGRTRLQRGRADGFKKGRFDAQKINEGLRARKRGGGGMVINEKVRAVAGERVVCRRNHWPSSPIVRGGSRSMSSAAAQVSAS
jgi:hypothetical protein